MLSHNGRHALCALALLGGLIAIPRLAHAQEETAKYPPFVWEELGFTEECEPNDMLKRLISVFTGPRAQDDDAERIIDEPLYQAVSANMSQRLMLDEWQDWHGLKLTGIQTYSGVERGPFNYFMVFDEDVSTVRAVWNKLGWKLPEANETREMIPGYAFMSVIPSESGGAMVACLRD